MAFVKGLIPGILISWLFSSILGRNHQKGDWLFIHLANLPRLEQYSFYWSWPLFFGATLLGWFVFATTSD